MTSFWHRKSEPMWSKMTSWATLVATSETLFAPSSLKIIGKTYYSSNIAAKKLFLCAQMPCIAISLHTLCSNHGIISFPIVKLTIPGGHDLVLAPKI